MNMKNARDSERARINNLAYIKRMWNDQSSDYLYTDWTNLLLSFHSQYINENI